jgi:hypothetical protein
LIYRHVLQQSNISDPLYLAVPTTAFHGIFREIALPLLAAYQIRLIVIDLEQEEIEQWIE